MCAAGSRLIAHEIHSEIALPSIHVGAAPPANRKAMASNSPARARELRQEGGRLASKTKELAAHAKSSLRRPGNPFSLHRRFPTHGAPETAFARHAPRVFLLSTAAPRGGTLLLHPGFACCRTSPGELRSTSSSSLSRSSESWSSSLLLPNPLLFLPQAFDQSPALTPLDAKIIRHRPVCSRDESHDA